MEENNTSVPAIVLEVGQTLEDLKLLPTWLCWKLNGTQKQPMFANGNTISGSKWNAPETYADKLVTYAEAKAACERFNGFNLALHLPANMVCIDLDNKKEAGGDVSPLLSDKAFGKFLVNNCVCEWSVGWVNEAGERVDRGVHAYGLVDWTRIDNELYRRGLLTGTKEHDADLFHRGSKGWIAFTEDIVPQNRYVNPELKLFDITENLIDQFDIIQAAYHTNSTQIAPSTTPRRTPAPDPAKVSGDQTAPNVPSGKESATGGRHINVRDYLVSLRKNGVIDFDVLLNAGMQFDRANNRPPLQSEDNGKEIHNITRWVVDNVMTVVDGTPEEESAELQPEPVLCPRTWNLMDVSALYAKIYNGEVYYIPQDRKTSGLWLVWDERAKIWNMSASSSVITSSVNKFLRMMRHEANQFVYKYYGMLKTIETQTAVYDRIMDNLAKGRIPWPEEAKYVYYYEYRKQAEKLTQKAQYARDIVTQVMSFPSIAGRMEWFTQPDPDLLNTPDGLVNLRTGEIRETTPADHLMNITACGIGAEVSDEWKSFVLDCADGDEEYAGYLQRLFGMACFGGGKPRGMYFLYGAKGHNGKSTLLNAIASTLGIEGTGYASSVPARIVCTECGRFDRAQLIGRRLIISNELDKNARLDSGTFNDMTGNDVISIERKGIDQVSVKPTWTMFFGVNHLPAADQQESAIWERYHVLPFDHIMPTGEENGEKFGMWNALVRDHGEAIMKWLIDGAEQYAANGLGVIPEVIAKAEAEAREVNDPVKQFINDDSTIWIWSKMPVIIRQKQKKTNPDWNKLSERAVYDLCLQWCGMSKLAVPSRKDMMVELRTRLQSYGCVLKSHAGSLYWCGLRLSSNDTDEEIHKAIAEASGYEVEETDELLADLNF